MFSSLFYGGVQLPDHKDATSTELIEVLDAPKEAIIHLSQHVGAPAKPIVKVKDEVRTGQKIADSDAFICTPIHASITGTVTAIEPRHHPAYGKSLAVVIQGIGLDMLDYKPVNRNWQDMKPSDIISIIKSAGIVGLGGTAFPTHLKLTPPSGKKIDVLIINGVECEPFATSDDRLMREHADELIEGVRILKRATAATEVVIAIGDNKHLAISSIEKSLKKLEDSLNPINLMVLKSKYPLGSEKQLISAITGEEIPSEGFSPDVGAIVFNVATAYAVFEAVVRGKPLYERIVTVTGDCVAKPGNFLARIGTSFKVLVEAAGGLSKEPVKVIAGGPMRGFAQCSLDTPLVKSTSCIVLMSKELAEIYEPQNCIRCGACIRHCPQKLMPIMLMKLSKKEKWSKAKYEYNLMDCIECGCCAYVCPARIPIVQWINLAKQKAWELKL